MESELVSGFMTEHSAVIFVFFFLAEYASIILMCILISILFLGGYNLDYSIISSLIVFIYNVFDFFLGYIEAIYVYIKSEFNQTYNDIVICYGLLKNAIRVFIEHSVSGITDTNAFNDTDMYILIYDGLVENVNNVSVEDSVLDITDINGYNYTENDILIFEDLFEKGKNVPVEDSEFGIRDRNAFKQFKSDLLKHDLDTYFENLLSNPRTENITYTFIIGLKTAILIFVYIWVRASFPRIRYDQLMSYCWTVLLPLVFAFILLIPCILYVYEIIPSNVLFS